MLYFGGDSLNSHKNALLEHCILSLKTVHHKGSAIIKLPDTSTLFTCSLIFLMYLLYDKIAVSKPFSGDFTTED